MADRIRPGDICMVRGASHFHGGRLVEAVGVHDTFGAEVFWRVKCLQTCTCARTKESIPAGDDARIWEGYLIPIRGDSPGTDEMIRIAGPAPRETVGA